MFIDPLSVPILVTGSTLDAGGSISSPVIDPGAIQGRTVRRIVTGALAGTITISHSVTKENKPYNTDRVSVRVDLGKVDSEGVPVVAFAQVVLGFPKSGMTFAECDTAARHALALVAFGDEAGGLDGAAGVAFRTRLLAGEG